MHTTYRHVYIRHDGVFLNVAYVPTQLTELVHS